MDPHEQQVLAFLQGDLTRKGVAEFDRHLLECDECWQAVHQDRHGRVLAEYLRESAPPDVADRLRLAVEMTRPPRARTHGLRRAALAVTGVVVASVAVLVPLAARSSPAGSVTAVARLADISPVANSPALSPRAIGGPSTLQVGGQTIEVRRYPIDQTEAVVATSDQSFPMPSGARVLPGRPVMTWVARQGEVSLYCLTGRRSILIASRAGPGALARLAGSIPPD